MFKAVPVSLTSKIETFLEQKILTLDLSPHFRKIMFTRLATLYAL